jgi:uncharacterized protein GlcG (DUF336 family)
VIRRGRKPKFKVDDEVVDAIGAAGAPGANLDEACARAGLDKIRDQLR